MRRVAPALLALLLTLPALPAIPQAIAASAADARRACRTLTGTVEARRGIRHRSLVIVPLVAKTKQPLGGPTPSAKLLAAPTLSRKGFTWLAWNAPGGDEGASIKAPPTQPRALHPSGLILEDPVVGERLLIHPWLHAKATTVEAPTVTLLPLVRGAMPDMRPAGGLRGVASSEFRQTLFLTKDVQALRDLLALAGTLAGLDPQQKKVKLSDVLEAPKLEARTKLTRDALASLPTAYGGEVHGHVAFLGNRPVELVLARRAATYASYAREALPALALSLGLWEQMYARDDLPAESKPPTWPAFLAETTRILSAVSGASARQERVKQRTASHGDLWRLRGAAGKHAKKSSDLGWLLLDEKERGVWLEAWPTGEVGPLPPPAKEPGGKGQDEDPHDRKGGGLTKDYLDRFLERFHKRRRALERGR